MKRVGRAGFRGWSSGMLDCGGVMGAGPGVPVWARRRVAENKDGEQQEGSRGRGLGARFRCWILDLQEVPPPPYPFVQSIQNTLLKSGLRFLKSGLKCETPAFAGVCFAVSII